MAQLGQRLGRALEARQRILVARRDIDQRDRDRLPEPARMIARYVSCSPTRSRRSIS